MSLIAIFSERCERAADDQRLALPLRSPGILLAENDGQSPGTKCSQSRVSGRVGLSLASNANARKRLKTARPPPLASTQGRVGQSKTTNPSHAERECRRSRMPLEWLPRADNPFGRCGLGRRVGDWTSWTQAGRHSRSGCPTGCTGSDQYETEMRDLFV